MDRGSRASSCVGANFGWPYFEGPCGSCGYANPTYSYGHLPVDAATSAVAAYSGSTFPTAYDHVVFFGDYTYTPTQHNGYPTDEIVMSEASTAKNGTFALAPGYS